jgi:hypothetical protein
MSTLQHPPVEAAERRDWRGQLLVAEMWASLAIAPMWAAVAVVAIWGPDFVSSSGAGTDTTTIPSAIVVAVCAALGSWAVAKYAFPRRTDSPR